MKNNSQNFGKLGEELAQTFLKKKGYKILATNWRYKKLEIDIIGENDDFIVFFEVKSRTNDAFGDPEMFVTRKKQKFLITAADRYLQEGMIEKEARFDIIAVLQINNKLTLKHLEGAFYPTVK